MTRSLREIRESCNAIRRRLGMKDKLFGGRADEVLLHEGRVGYLEQSWRQDPARIRILGSADVAAIYGLDMDDVEDFFLNVVNPKK